jgi:subtilisin family serine protease
VDDYDYSIDRDRIAAIQNVAEITGSSNWLNAVCIRAEDIDLQKLKKFDFVSSVVLLKKTNGLKSTNNKLESNFTIQAYGDAYRQINMHHGDLLHSDNFLGNGIKIAVFDAGFPDVNQLKSFQHLFQESRIFPVRNIVYNSSNLFTGDGHGTSVMGCMAAYIADTIVGSAPKASYYLFITEDSRSESKLEEINWAIAAQMADSLGIDIINSSLGYSEFDDLSTNYKPSDMDGHTSIVSKAAAIACSKGILVVNAAGNLGEKSWRIISAPADAEDVISVGAVNRDGEIATFSSRGYNANNIIKPDIVSVGKGATINYINGQYITSNGTSFAAPIMAGLIACYWQKNPTWNAAQIRKSLYESADNYRTPNREYGFGKVDFKRASFPIASIQDSLRISVFPNPSQNTAIVEFNSTIEILNSELEVFHFDKKILVQKLSVKSGYNQLFIDLSGRATGLYFIKIKMDNYFLSGKFEKL